MCCWFCVRGVSGVCNSNGAECGDGSGECGAGFVSVV